MLIVNVAGAECPKTHQEDVAAIFPGVDMQGMYADYI
jgi:hypothetical protein